MIIKLQCPLASNMRQPLWLAYDETRTPTYHIEESNIPEHARLAVGPSGKAYFNAEIVAGRLVIGPHVAGQPW